MEAVRASEERYQREKIERQTEIENAFTVLTLDQVRHARGERLLKALAEAVFSILTQSANQSEPEGAALHGETNISRQASDTTHTAT